MRSLSTVEELEEQLSAPRAGLVEDLAELDGDILVLGAGGKLGPSLVRLATRAIAQAGSRSRVIAVSRFGTVQARAVIEDAGAVAVAADLFDDDALRALPDVPNLIYLVGVKFGSSGHEPAMWATNAYLPGRIARRFPGARIVALSTGNVYPFVPISAGGATESVPPGPLGEYAMSSLARERVLTHVTEVTKSPLSLIRLNYAAELRYGVLADIAADILAGQPIDLTTGHVNVVWQGYANEVTLRMLRYADTPPFVLNVTGPETVSVRSLATKLAERMGREVQFTGEEAPTALLSDASRCHGLFGYPSVTLDELIDLTAHWVLTGGPSLGKPTKFQRRDGQF